MSTGEILGLTLLGFLVLWGVADYIVWMNGKQTFSQWVIKNAKKYRSFAIGTVLVIVGFATWLILHFELPAILF